MGIVANILLILLGIAEGIATNILNILLGIAVGIVTNILINITGYCSRNCNNPCRGHPHDTRTEHRAHSQHPPMGFLHHPA